MGNRMRKQWIRLIAILFLMPAYVAYADDNKFNELEAKGIFGKIKFNMVVSCYTKKQSTAEPVDLQQLKARFPEKVKACTCFEEELSKTSNRQIFDDSRRAYELSHEKAQAMKQNDTARLIKISEKEKSFKPFMTYIVEKCGLIK